MDSADAVGAPRAVEILDSPVHSQRFGGLGAQGQAPLPLRVPGGCSPLPKILPHTLPFRMDTASKLLRTRDLFEFAPTLPRPLRRRST